MKLYYTRTWETEIDNELIDKEIEKYLYETHSVTLNKRARDIITMRIMKHTPYAFEKVPDAFLTPIKEYIKNY